MFSGRPRLSGPCATLLLLSASVASAEPESQEQAILWYRSTEGCPDGARFMESMGARSAHVRLAEAGDRVDFVVNLALTPEGARGRLERETERGTVAIREVVDASCEQVAQVIALNLSLALDPTGGVPPSEEVEPTDATSAQDFTEETPSQTEAEPPAEAQDQNQRTSASTSTSSREPEAPEPTFTRWRAGLQVGAQSGITPSLAARGTLFLEAQGLISSLPTLTVRVATVGVVGSSDTQIGTIQQSLWAGRLEVCPVSLRAATLEFTPCVAGEVGQLRAAGPLSDAAPFGAVGAHTRGIWTLSNPLSLEADVGVSLPLRKYEVAAGSATLYRSAPVGVFAVLGAAVVF